MAAKLSTKTCETCGGVGTTPADGTGAILRERREAVGIPATAMATTMGISTSYLHDLERDNRGWSNELVAGYLKALEELGG